MRRLQQPEYLISSLIQSAGPNVSAAVRVSKLGETMKEWVIDGPASDLFEGESATAIEIMEFLTR